jgi:hypothetical protein
MSKFSLKILPIFVGTLLFAGCGMGGKGGNGSKSQNLSDISKNLESISSSELSSFEEKSLLLIREEEKLARDVYLYLDAKWGDEVKNFKNISEAEQIHSDSVKLLLDRYSLEDPMAENQTLGIFANEELQNLYNELSEKGSKSLVEALIVGATIEDLDIYDIETEMENIDNEDILYIYRNLVLGSENHMRAFMKKLEANGGSYSPQFISSERFESIF